MYSTEGQKQYPERLTVLIISIDHLSEHFQDLPVDNILALGDQELLRRVLPDNDLGGGLLSQSITEPDVFGPPVNVFHQVLVTMSNRPSCEMLLYISGHGMDPGNICLIPNAIKPHPARKDLHIHKPNECYFVKSEEKYLSEFYQICNKAIGTSERGFVGGEVFIHQRGFIGVLGVIGLWCCYHCERRDDVFHHMVIVVDCCFAGRWGNTLELIIKCKDVALNEYCQLLRRFPMSIQCATNECEPSYGSLFTPLWCFMNTASAEELKYYRDLYRSQGSSVPDVQQHPFFISTSSYCPPLKCFNDADFFAYLSSKQVEELEEDLKDVRNGETLDVALTPEEQVDFKRFKHFSPLARPLVIAIAAVARELKNLRQSKVRQAEQFNTSSPQLQELPQAAKQCQQHIDQSLEALKYHMLRLLMCHRNHYVLDEQGNLNESNHATLRKMLESRHTDRKVPPGVYVFQGGQGDMSLIVTPGQEEVILIDGTKTAECFKAAWNSILRYLRRITKIVVTHHDEDHTYGIQLLLARYIVGENSDRLPDLDNAIIYMNTRNDIINTARNFKHEKEIQTLAEHLGLEVQPLIVENGFMQGTCNPSKFLSWSHPAQAVTCGRVPRSLSPKY